MCEMHRKINYREFYYNIAKMFMNNIIILLLAVRICKVLIEVCISENVPL